MLNKLVLAFSVILLVSGCASNGGYVNDQAKLDECHDATLSLFNRAVKADFSVNEAYMMATERAIQANGGKEITQFLYDCMVPVTNVYKSLGGGSFPKQEIPNTVNQSKEILL